jgi:hypothetical protein
VVKATEVDDEVDAGSVGSAQAQPCQGESGSGL